MKRIKSILTVLMAAIFALSLVPAGAFAAAGDPVTGPESGTIDQTTPDKGTIRIENAKAGETYSVYKIFDLASFDDGEVAPGDHTSDKYSYVIPTNSNWLTWLETTKGYMTPKGSGWMESTDPGTALFWREAQPVTIQGNQYYVVTATSNFSNAWDVSNADSTNSTPAGTGTFDYDGNVDYVNNASPKESITAVQKFAQEALAYAESNNDIQPAATPVTASSESVTFSELDLGYYLMGTTMGTLASLDTTNDTVVVYEKNEAPELVKKVLKKGATFGSTASELLDVADNSTQWVENTDAKIGDYVQFKTVVTAQQGADRYTLHDVMEQGLTFQNATTGDHALKVYLVRGNGTGSTDANFCVEIPSDSNKNWELKASSSAQTDDCDFEIEFKDATPESDSAAADQKVTLKDANNTLRDIKDGDKIVVTYWAQLNEDAVVFGSDTAGSDQSEVKTNDGNTTLDSQPYTDQDNDGRNTNTTVLTYGNKSYTNWDTAEVTTYQFDVVKTEADAADGTTDNKSNLLEGAHFSLYKATRNTPTDTTGLANLNYGTGNNFYQEGSKLTFTLESDGYRHDAVSASGTTTDLVSGDDREIRLYGLDAGIYMLVEDTAPNGYNKLSNPIVIEIKEDAEYDGSNASDSTPEEGQIKVYAKDNNGATSDVTGFKPWDAYVVTNSGTTTYTTGTYTVNSVEKTNGGVQVINNTGAELPSTGGIGTTIFYVAGTVLVVGAVVMLVAKRRMGAEA